MPKLRTILSLGVAAFLLRDHHHGIAVEKCSAADNRAVVVILTITVEFLEVLADGGDVIERVWPLGVARDLHLLPRREIRVDVTPDGVDFPLDRADLAADICVRFKRTLAQLFELADEFTQWFLKLQHVGRRFHSGCWRAYRRGLIRVNGHSALPQNQTLSPG
jgi:hypothetical protein